MSVDYPHLSTSSDGTVDCDCCGKGLVEIKCPRKYSTGLKGWEIDKNFSIDSSKNVKKIVHILYKFKGKFFCLV